MRTIGVIEVTEDKVTIYVPNRLDLFEELKNDGARITWLKKELKVGILDDVKVVFVAVSDVEEIIKEEFYREVV